MRNEPIRAVFCEGPEWVGEDNANRVVDRTLGAGFNTLITGVWHGDGVTWPSTVCSTWSDNHRVQDYLEPGMDPLQILLDAAHAKGLEVHPMFTVMAVRRDDFLTEYLPVGGKPEDMFDAHNVDFQNFMIALAREVIEDYPIDGLLLDYVRTGNGFYLNDDWQAQYTNDTGRNMDDDWHDLLDEWNNGNPHPDAYALVNWQEAAVGHIVRKIASRFRVHHEEKPFSTYGTPFDHTLAQGRVPLKWATAGTIDINFQGKYQDPPDWQAYYDDRDQFPNPEQAGLFVANYTKGPPFVRRDGELVGQFLYEARQNAHHHGLYLYEQMWDDQMPGLHHRELRHRVEQTQAYADLEWPDWK